VPVCPAVPCDVTPAVAEQTGLGLLGRAGMVAVRAADLASPARVGLGSDGRTALVAAGTGAIRSGDVVVWHHLRDGGPTRSPTATNTTSYRSPPR
jgi:hypothetical protein